MKLKNLLVMIISFFVVGLFVQGCGPAKEKKDTKKTGVFQDVIGAKYNTSSGLFGYTSRHGEFYYEDGDFITFSSENIILGRVKANKLIDVSSFSSPDLVSQTLHALDKDGNLSNGIDLQNKSITSADTVKSMTTSQAQKSEQNDISGAINLDKIDGSYQKYITFLQANGLNLQDKNIALMAEIMKNLHLKPYNGEKSYVPKIMAGEMYTPPFSRYKNDSKIIGTIKNHLESFGYRVQNVTLYQMMLQTIATQSESSNKIVTDADYYKKQGDLLVKTTMYNVDNVVDGTKSLLENESSKKLLKILALNTASFGIDNLPDDIQPEAKLTMTLATKCMGEEKDVADCAIDSAGGMLDAYIRDNLDGQSAVLAKGTAELASNLVKVAKNCNSDAIKKDLASCVKDVTHATAGKLLETAMTTMEIYSLDKDLESQNSELIATDMFYTGHYAAIMGMFNGEKDDTKYCYLAPFYTFESEFDKCKKNVSPLQFVVNKVIKSIEDGAALTSNWHGGIDVNLTIVRNKLSELEKQYQTLFAKNLIKLKKYKRNPAKTEQEWLYNQVVISEPTVSILTKNLEQATVQACFNITARRGIYNITPSLQLISQKKQEEVDLQFEDVNDIIQTGHTAKYCAKAQYAGDISSDTLLVKNQITFDLSNDKNKELRTVKNFALYNQTVEKNINDLEVDFRPSYNDIMKTYYFYSSIFDNRNMDQTEYKYQWNVNSDENCSYTLYNDKGYLDYGATTGITYGSNEKKIDKECLLKTFVVNLNVYDSNGTYLGSKKRMISPIELPSKATPLNLEITPQTLNINAGEVKYIHVTVSGGQVSDYDINVNLDNKFFTLKKNSPATYVLTTKGVSSVKKEGHIEFTVSDGDTSLTKGVSVTQLAQPQSKILSMATSENYKVPYSHYPDKPAEITPGSKLQQQWWLQNSSSQTLYDVTLKLSKYCKDTTLEHLKGNISLGDMSPNDIKTPTINISGGEEGSENYCQWNLYAKTSPQGEEKRLIWNNSKTNASLNYWIYSKTKKDLNRPIITESAFSYKDQKLNGTFSILQTSNQIKHLRVVITPDRYGGTPKKVIDINGDYEAIQSGGKKEFSYVIPNTWSKNTAYVHINAENKDGLPLASEFVQGIQLINFVPFKNISLAMSKVSPQNGAQGDVFKFVVNLNRTLEEGENVYLNFNVPNSTTWLDQNDSGGHVLIQCSGTQCIKSTSINGVGTRYVRAGIFINEEQKSNYSNVETFNVDTKTTTSDIDEKYKILQGETFYEEDGTTWKFNDDLTSVLEKGINHGLNPEKNGLKIPGTDTKYLVLTQKNDDFITLQYMDITPDGVILDKGDSYQLFFSNSTSTDAGELSTLIVGKTFYYYCKDDEDVRQSFFNENGTLEDKFVNSEHDIYTSPYRIDGNVLYIKDTENGQEDSWQLIDYNDKHISFSHNGDTFTIYTTEELASQSPDDCDNSKSLVMVKNMLSGKVVFKNADGTSVSVPDDAYVRVVPKIFYDNNNWNGVRCKISSDGTFGSECSIDDENDESKLRDLLNKSDEKFQIVVFKNDINPDEQHWDCGEDVYKYVGQDIDSSNWVHIEVFPEDYEDRSGEECNDVNPTGYTSYLGVDYKIMNATSYMSDMDHNEVQIFLRTDNNNAHKQGGLQLTFKRSRFDTNDDLKNQLVNNGSVYISSNDLINYGFQFMIEDNNPTGVTWKNGTIKLTWLGNDTFSIEQNGADLSISDGSKSNKLTFSKTNVQWTNQNHKDGSTSETANPNTLSVFDENSYFPVIENKTWTYSDGSRVKVESVNTSTNEFVFKNIDDNGSAKCVVQYDNTSGYYVSDEGFSNPNFMPLRQYFGFNPLAFDNSHMTLGYSWEESGNSNGYKYINKMKITSTDTDIAGNDYDFKHCLVLERNIEYPDGYDWDVYLTKVIYYLKKGVGYVKQIQYWSDGSTTSLHVTSYN